MTFSYHLLCLFLSTCEVLSFKQWMNDIWLVSLFPSFRRLNVILGTNILANLCWEYACDGCLKSVKCWMYNEKRTRASKSQDFLVICFNCRYALRQRNWSPITRQQACQFKNFVIKISKFLEKITWHKNWQYYLCQHFNLIYLFWAFKTNFVCLINY